MILNESKSWQVLLLNRGELGLCGCFTVWWDWIREDAETSVPARVALPFQRQQLPPSLGVGGGGYRRGLEEVVGLGLRHLFVLAGSARPSLLTVNHPIQAWHSVVSQGCHGDG